jgi:hypothetical protein
MMRKMMRPTATNAAMTAPAMAPLFGDLFCGVVVDPWIVPSTPEDAEGTAGEVVPESPGEDTGVTLGDEIAVDGVEAIVGAGPAVILNRGLSARTF